MKLKKIIVSLAVLLTLPACSTARTQTEPAVTRSNQSIRQSNSATTYQDYDLLSVILRAEQSSSGKVRDVLATTRQMSLTERAIVKGGCWDYLDAAWTRAGVPRNARVTTFKGNIKGEFVNPNELRAGDWIYHVNYSYNNIEHSGMFIGWVDKSKRLGVTLSYAGSNRKEPARYKVYDLSGVYNIMRAS
ncbi:hypothetical protein [Kingella negevensis]|uniref:hypothetical protein n=1 Tax=Kingella negevensis TaxID=1522312 RepID=UPI00050A1EDC|nr:hypothetical protein [Kingella negevensis]MDK4687797.1 hypothetical protein [Kingella negevensis]WII91207.1 hypothetical protein QEO93_01020 [Kingella negevensis]